jgi:hypothetical protein
MMVTQESSNKPQKFSERCAELLHYSDDNPGDTKSTKERVRYPSPRHVVNPFISLRTFRDKSLYAILNCSGLADLSHPKIA